jgi:hypothetical protein
MHCRAPRVRGSTEKPDVKGEPPARWFQACAVASLCAAAAFACWVGTTPPPDAQRPPDARPPDAQHELGANEATAARALPAWSEALPARVVEAASGAATHAGELPGVSADCRAPTRDTFDVQRQPLYQWRDAEDRLVFGDRVPDGIAATSLGGAYTPMEQFARVSIASKGSRHAAEIASVIEADVAHMSRLLRDALQVPVRQIQLDITFYGSKEALPVDPTSGAFTQNLAGFYQHGSNRVAVADQPDLEATRRVARHEASHALLAGIYGPTPLWLNEGLAEVMEMLEIAGQTRTIAVHRLHAAHLRAAFGEERSDALQALIAMNADAWNGSPSIETYAPAWALVHELLTHDAGRTLLSAVLSAQLANPCIVLDSAALIEDFYPGGLYALERRWLSRMREGNWRPLPL